MTYEEANQFCREWLQAWVGGKDSAPKLLSYYHPEAQLTDPNHKTPLKGHEELKPFFEAMLGNYPDWKFEIKSLYPIEDGFVFIYQTDIRHLGKVFEGFRGIDVIRMKDGLIIDHEGFYDRTPLVLERLGVVDDQKNVVQ